MKKLIILLAVIVVVVSGWYFLKSKAWVSRDGFIFRPCTEEAKICPDGSAVGRTGLRCEFAACPDVRSSTSNISVDISDWQTYRNDEYGFEFKYPPFLIKENPTNPQILREHDGFPCLAGSWADFYNEVDLNQLVGDNAIDSQISTCVFFKDAAPSEMVWKLGLGDTYKGSTDKDFFAALPDGLIFRARLSGGINKEIDQILSTFKFTK